MVVMVGQDSGEHVDDRRIALMAVQTDMAARLYDGAAETEFAVLDAIDLPGERNAGEHALVDQFVIRRGGLLSQCKSGSDEPQGDSAECPQTSYSLRRRSPV